MDATSQRGFTLWELIFTMIVAGTILGIGVPNFMEFQRNNAMAAAANDLVSAVLLARGEAAKRQVPVTLCASADPTVAAPNCNEDGAGANGGFIVWVDGNGNTVVDAGEQLLLQREAPGGAIDVWGDSGYIVYGPNGFPRDAVAGLGDRLTTVVFCDDRGNRTAAGGGSAARALRIEATGRAQVLRGIQNVTDALTAINASGTTTACP